jgi:4-amino-4-deoxy-L-arabinose transferase-like glycosyltransferase
MSRDRDLIISDTSQQRCGMRRALAYYPIILIAIVSLMLRLYLRSNYLDDWDSIQFSLALDNYSIASHQPHPPGYPVYIFLGRLVHLVVPDTTASLVYLSILFGTLSIIAIYILSKKFFGETVGLVSALMLSFTPAHLKFSDVAMSDIVSLFFIVITIYFLYNSTDSKKYLYLASISLGITVGVRQTDIILIPLYLVFLVARRNDLKTCILSIIIFSISVCAWLIPTIMDTGLHTFIELQRSQGAYAVSTSTLNSLGGFGLINLAKTVKQFMILLTSGWSISLLIFSAMTLIFFLYNKQKISKNYRDIRILILA